MQYDTGKHCVFYHRHHLVWSTKYWFKVLTGQVRLRVRDICRQVCRENEVDILRGVLSSYHVHMFVSVPPMLAISDLVRKMKGRSSQGATGVPATAQALLGPQVLRARVFLDHQRRHHGRRRTSVLGRAHRRSYRCQPVVVQSV